MIKLFRWILGYVKFTFSKGFCEGFVDDCFKAKINLHNIMRSANQITAICNPQDYAKLHKLAIKNGGKVKIEQRKGLLFPVLKILKRPGILIGLLAFVIIINFLGGFVWQIEISGNENITDKQILTFLENNGYYEGVYNKSVDKDLLENLMMATFENLAWVNINQSASTATVELREAVMQPKVVNNKGYANLKATKDGTIVSAKATNGWQVAMVGDGVTRGDLLVSGIYESEDNEVNLYAHASGVFIAQVDEKFNLVVNREQTTKQYTQSKEYKYLAFFGLKIPLFIGSTNIQDSDTIESTQYLKLNGRKLPIGIRKKIVKPYKAITNNLSDKELTQLMKKKIDEKLENDFKDCEIIKKDIDIELNASNAVAKGNLICLENIGEEVEIKMKK